MLAESQPKTADCPQCRASVAMPEMVFFGDLSCPECAEKIWYLQTPDKIQMFVLSDSHDLRERIITRLDEELDLDRATLESKPLSLQDMGDDSLEVLELVMSVEEEVDRVA